MIRAVDNIGVCTTDIARLHRFYQKLGFAEVYRNERGVLIAAGDCRLFIFATRQKNPPSVARELGLFDNPPGLDHISLEVDDVDRMYSTLKADGCEFAGPPEDQSWGARMARLKDPDGNNLYLLQKL